MDRNYIVFIDTSSTSPVLTLTTNPLFNTWLHAFDNIPQALDFMTARPLPYATDVYVAKDDILENGLPQPNGGPMRTLLETFDDLRSIRHIVVFSSENVDAIHVQILSILNDKRLLKKTIRINDLQCHLCKAGIEYLQEVIEYYVDTEQTHLTDNLQQDIRGLEDQMRRHRDDQERRLRDLQEAHANRSGQQPD